jgi:hypothetical protein
MEKNKLHKDSAEGLEWDHEIPFYNRFLVQDVLKGSIIPVIILGIIAFLNLYAFVLLGLAFVLVALILLILWNSRRQVHFRVDEHGASFFALSKTRNVSRSIGFSILVMAIAQRMSGIVGIGLAQSRAGSDSTSLDIEWDDIDRVVLYPKERVVVLKRSWKRVFPLGFTSLRLYCTSENYESVAAKSLAHVQKRLNKGAMGDMLDSLVSPSDAF